METETMTQRLSYNLKEATEVTGLNRAAIYRAITAGTLKTFKAGRRRMVSAKELRDYIDRLQGQASEAA